MSKNYSKIAKRLLKSFMVNIPSNLQQEIVEDLENFIQQAMSPIPETDPQRIESSLARKIQHETEPFLEKSGRVLTIEDAHSFLRTLVRESKISLRSGAINKAVENSLGYSFEADSQVTGQLRGVLSDMVAQVADDPMRGPQEGQKVAVKLLKRRVGLEEWEAQQVLGALTKNLEVSLDLALDQVDIIFSSFVKTASLFKSQKPLVLDLTKTSADHLPTDMVSFLYENLNRTKVADWQEKKIIKDLIPSEEERKNALEDIMRRELARSNRSVRLEFSSNEYGTPQITIIDETFDKEITVTNIPDAFLDTMLSVDWWTMSEDEFEDDTTTTKLLKEYADARSDSRKILNIFEKLEQLDL